MPPPVFAATGGGRRPGRRQAQRFGGARTWPAYVAAAPGLRLFSGDDSNPAATMRAGGAGVISGRSGAYPEVYAALVAALARGRRGGGGRHQLVLDRIVGPRGEHRPPQARAAAARPGRHHGPDDGRSPGCFAGRGDRRRGGRAVISWSPPCYQLAVNRCEPRAGAARHFFRGPAKAGRRASNWLGNRAGAGQQARRERGTGQLAGVSGAPGLIRCSSVLRRAPGAHGQ